MNIKTTARLLSPFTLLLSVACGGSELPIVEVDRVEVGLSADGRVTTTVFGSSMGRMAATDPDVDPMYPSEAGATDPDVDPMKPRGAHFEATDPDVDPMDEGPAMFAANCADHRGAGASDAAFDVVVYVSASQQAIVGGPPSIRCAMYSTIGDPSVRLQYVDFGID